MILHTYIHTYRRPSFFLNERPKRPFISFYIIRSNWTLETEPEPNSPGVNEQPQHHDSHLRPQTPRPRNRPLDHPTPPPLRPRQSSRNPRPRPPPFPPLRAPIPPDDIRNITPTPRDLPPVAVHILRCPAPPIPPFRLRNTGR